MPDTLSPVQRSERMARVRHKNTRPELFIRRLVHRMGYRFRLHREGLPGKPDLVFPARRKVIFVHGCFWHRHSDPDCKLARLPKSRLDFWLPKLEANRERDDRIHRELIQLGWKPLAIWECELKEREQLENKLRDFLDAVD